MQPFETALPLLRTLCQHGDGFVHIQRGLIKPTQQPVTLRKATVSDFGACDQCHLCLKVAAGSRNVGTETILLTDPLHGHALAAIVSLEHSSQHPKTHIKYL